MSGAVEGVDYAEAARVMFEACPDRFMRAEQCYAAIDALAAAGFITTPPARSYADGVRDSAKVCADRAAGRLRLYEDNQAEINAYKAIEAEDAAAQILALLSQGGKA